MIIKEYNTIMWSIHAISLTSRKKFSTCEIFKSDIAVTRQKMTVWRVLRFFKRRKKEQNTQKPQKQTYI